MLEHIYNIFGQCLIMIEMLIVAHYVFLEPRWKRWQYIVNVVSFLLIIASEFLIVSELKVFIGMLCAGVNISIARENRRIRGFFLIIPIFGICCGLAQLIIVLPELLFGVNWVYYDMATDIFSGILLLIFAWKGKCWRDRFELEMQYRKLRRWESRLLIVSGLVMCTVAMYLFGGVDMSEVSPTLKSYIALLVSTAFILMLTMIVLVMQGNKSAYYEAMADVNERYLRAEIAHFNAYQEVQTETRRVRHDMKNHMLCLSHLANEGKLDEIKQYLSQLNLAVEQLDMELHCGNILADAICNEKQQLASEQGISIEIEGRMPEDIRIDSIDICTIFANALDNAIEAVAELDSNKRWIRIEISHQEQILFVRFINPIASRKNIFLRTSKKDTLNHGFGLQNIRRSVEKYHGEMCRNVQEEDNYKVYSLEIMFMGETFTTK